MDDSTNIQVLPEIAVFEASSKGLEQKSKSITVSGHTLKEAYEMYKKLSKEQQKK